MPTPFSHLAALIQLLDDERIPLAYREALRQQRPAFLLGAVAPDARVDAPDPRAATHFYAYRDGITRPPWRIMLETYSTLAPTNNPTQQAFLAAYVGHLTMDAVWTQEMLGPHFASGNWGANRKERFFILHLLLIDMDERDLAQLPAWVAAELLQSAPSDAWLPFMPLSVLVGWQKLIYDQIKPGGASQTLIIFGERINCSPAELRQKVDDATWMQAHLWDHVPRSVLAEVEAQMYTQARQAMIAYLDEFTTLDR